MAMNNAKNNKLQRKARVAVLASTLALGMCPIAAIAQTAGQKSVAAMERPSLMRATEQQTDDAQQTDGAQQNGDSPHRMDGWRPDGAERGGMQDMQPESGMPRFDGGQPPMHDDFEQPGGEAMPTEGERPELPEGERPELPEGERPELPEGERPELPDGERPELPDGERPELPDGVNANAGDADSATGETEKNSNKDTQENSDDTAPSAKQSDEEHRPAQDSSFMHRMGDFFRGMFDWFSGTGR